MPLTNATLDKSNVIKSKDSLNILINNNEIKGNAVQIDSSNILGVQTSQSIDRNEDNRLPSYSNISENLGYINSRDITSKISDNIDLVPNSNAQSNIDSYLKSQYEKKIVFDDVTGDAYADGQSPLSNIYSNLDYLYKKSSADDRALVNIQIASQSPTSDIDAKLNYIYEKNKGNDHNILDNDRIASQGPISDIGTNLNYLYEKSTANYRGKLDNVRIADIGSNLNYLRERSTTGDHSKTNVFVLNQSPTSDIGSNLNYLYEKSTSNDHTSAYVQIASKNPALNTNIKNDHSANNNDFNELYVASEANMNYLYQSAKLSEGKGKNANNTASLVDSNLNSIIENRVGINKENFQLSIPINYYSGFQKHLSYENVGKSSPIKNYAVVVGINTYSDREGLHASVNDANSITSVLKSLGYGVTELTDQTENKPTKHNILDGALKELSLKKDIGKVLIYFSGHGEVDGKNNFYLIPQDGNGNPASYISEEELNSYIKGIRNLAIIIDSCNSGAFKAETGDCQVILTSSKDDEPSNEKWTEPVSVFTYFLCQAIREEEQSNRDIIIQSSFNEAYKNTVQWSSGHLLSQTPMLMDKTNGRYYLS